MGASQAVLPFKLAASDESLTAQSGLALFGEYLRAMEVAGLIDHELPRPGSAAGYAPSVHVLPLVLMLAGGGRTLEDLRVLRNDAGLRALLQLDEMPSSDATGDWLRRMGAGESAASGLAGLERVNRSVFRRLMRQDTGTPCTLDIDATQIVAEKREAHYTYKGEKGYMPMVGHLGELGLVVGYEFREGNVAPAARNLEFLQACEAAMPEGKRIEAIRADSAAYQAAIFNWCDATGKVFAIGADQDAAVKAAIAAIPKSDWKKFRDGEIAETVHCMNQTGKAFRLIVLRRPVEQDLFEDKGPYRYHAIASNRADEDAAATMQWYCKRGDASENRIKDLKIGFGMESMPCGTVAANAVFFAIGVLAYNLYLGFRRQALGSGWERSQVQSVRWRLFQTAGKIVRHGRQLVLKISAAMIEVFTAIRQRCAEIMREGGAVPETS
ncbi:MAG: IS1380 family transposase [Alphaproteobacteria bacterium]|nr:IS1380 family transposase [Alphaproteobacteria bacterium]